MFSAVIVCLLLAVSCSNAVPVRNLKDVTCQDGGVAACLAYCRIEGFNCGYCEGTEPNENCVCEHCPSQMKDEQDPHCHDGSVAPCLAYCASQGCQSGECDGSYPNQNCVCKECPEMVLVEVEPGCPFDCYQDCKELGCGSGQCEGLKPNDVCVCSQCPVCDQTECSSQCHEVGCEYAVCDSEQMCECSGCKSLVDDSQNEKDTDASCTYGGRAACIASCKLQNCDTGYCEGTAPNEVCVCSRCSADVEQPSPKDTDASCTYGGRAACIASCKIQGCATGDCVGTAPNEVCVCSRCNGTTVDVSQPKCVPEMCTQECGRDGCLTGACDSVSGQCVCSGYQTMMDWCTDGTCSQLCKLRGGCTGGYCVDSDECSCTGCPSLQSIDVCQNETCSRQCHDNNECQSGYCDKDGECMCVGCALSEVRDVICTRV
jgi:hypothetical protein